MFAILLFATIVALGANPAESEGEWIRLIQGPGFAGWMEPTKARDDDWVNAGAVFLSEEDERKLASKPGWGALVNGTQGRTRHLFTEQEFCDVEAHIEFMVPRGSNSGVYFMGRYEIQVLDSFGKEEVSFSDCGGIYQRWDPARGAGEQGYEGRSPRVNASRAPGRWQTFDVLFRGPRFDDAGNKTANACFIKVVHNGIVVHENEEVTGPTRAAAFGDEKPTGPFMFQGDHGPVAYRNLWVRPLQDAKATRKWDQNQMLTLVQWGAQMHNRNPHFRAAVPMNLVAAPKDTVPLLSGALRHEDPYVRCAAARAVGFQRSGKELLFPDLLEAIKDKNDSVRVLAAYALHGTEHQDAAIEAMIGLLKEGRPGCADFAAYTLPFMMPEAKAALPALKELAQSKDSFLREAARWAIPMIDK
jgi:hypothetical protein